MSGRQVKKHPSKSGLLLSDPQSTSCNAIRKKRKIEANSSEDEERSFWTPKHLGDLKAYNRSASEAPAELFRKDLISAMKLADNEPLTCDDFWGISDQWKQEWERGVQVPVNPDSLPEPSVIKHKEYPKRTSDFRLPGRLTRVTHNDFFNNEKHVLSNLPTKAEKMCRYDIDNLDASWLKSYNGERSRMGAEPVPDHIFEVIVEHLEEMCWENIHNLLKAEEPLSIEFDEDVICDVCRSPDSEEGNEMVFCDTCNICVHQACYGITAIPSGSWLCRTCSLGIKPNCVLCPNKGGAMKSTKSGHKWAHVACALWIPEVSIGSVERMEPITKITNIPQSRWALVCVLCRERWGACIQCSVKSCKTAYHVTCAFKHGLEMKAIIEDENDDGVKLRSYCEKHSRNSKKECSDVDSDGVVSALKKKKDMTNEQKSRAKAAKLRQIEADFYKYVDPLQTSTTLDIDFETTETIFYYWKLKRRSIFNKPLLSPRSQEFELLADNKEQDIECMKMFVQLRQYLERVRNLCYMVSRREKLSRTFFKTRELTFKTQSSLLSNTNFKSQELEAIIHANHSPSIYDHIYSHNSAPTYSQKEFEQMILLISGKGADLRKEKVKVKEKSEKQLDINGVIKRRFSSHYSKPANPYRKSYLNGAEQRKSRSRSVSQHGSSETSSTEDSDSSLASTKWKPPDMTGKKISVFTSSEDDQLEHPSKSINNNSKPHLFNFNPQKIKAFDTSDEDSKKIKPLPTSLRERGKGTVKRGRGRPPKVIKEHLFSSEDEKPTKDLKSFDALMKSTTRNFVDCNAKVEPKYGYDSSEEEQPRKIFSPRAAKSKAVKKNLNAAFTDSSCEDEHLPVTKSTSRGRGRGRGRSRGGTARASSNSAIYSWLTSSKCSDEDDLAPATYKLTSDEEDKSEASYKSPKNESEDSAKSGNELDTEVKDKQVKSDFDDVSGGETNYSQLVRTKGAVKEFTPKVEIESPVVVSKKKQVGRPPKKSKINDKDKKLSSDITKIRSADAEIPCDLNLFVPQRAAAKKASELITSQNSNPILVNTPQLPESEAVDSRKITKSVKDSMSESESLSGFNEEAKKSPQKVQKNRKEGKSKVECSDAPKKNIFEAPEILPYVPIREAARKAAENLKGGVKLNSLPGSVPEEPVEVAVPKPKKVQKIERSAAPGSSRTLRTKSPRSSSKGSNVSAASETEEEDETSPKVKTFTEGEGEKGRSMFSESDEETTVKKLLPQATESVGNRLFRGDIFVFDHQSSSEDDNTRLPSGSSKTKDSYRKSQEGNGSKKRNSFRSSKRFRSIFADEDEQEAENKEPTAETHRKAPDKKLKTSDGRTEHGFQPSVTKREESGAAAASQSENELHGVVTSIEESESRMRKSGPECRQGISSGDVTKTNVRSNSNATSSKRRRSRQQELTGEKAMSVGSSGEVEEASKGVKVRREIFIEETAKSENSKPIPEKGFKSTFQCITDGKEEKAPLEVHKKNSAVFSFTENEVQVKRLEDIVEASDSEIEPKKVKIVDSDDETSPKAKVEQPKDSGYKSSITTPEPNESTAPGMLKASQTPANDTESTRKKTQVAQVSPLDKSNSSKFLTSSRRKNLNAVIEERKKAAELSECRNIPSDANNSLQRSSTESHYMESDNSETLHEGNQSATESAGRSPSTSNFVEEWRTQWVKSPQPPQIERTEIRNQWVKSPQPIEHAERRKQWPKSPQHSIHMDHQDPAQPYKALPSHHHSIPMPDYPYLDLQQNIQNDFMYLTHLQMMQYHHYLRQFSVSSKPHENQIDESADLVRMAHREECNTSNIPIHLNQSSKLSLVDDQLQRVKIPPQARDDRQMLPEGQIKPDSRRNSDIPYPLNTAIAPKTPDVSNLPSADNVASSLVSQKSSNKITDKLYLPTYKNAHISSHDSVGTTSLKNVTHKSQIADNQSSSSTEIFDKGSAAPSTKVTKSSFSSKSLITSSNTIQESLSNLASPCIPPTSSVLPGITVGGQSVVSTSTVTTVHSVSTSVTSVSPSLPSNVTHSFANETLSNKKSSPEIDVVSTNISSPSSSVVTPTAVSNSSPLPNAISPPLFSAESKLRESETIKPNKASFVVDGGLESTPVSSEPSKRVPIYKQEPKTTKVSDKYLSPISNHSTSPRWSKEKKRTQKSTRGKKGRGRGVSKRGRPCRYNKVSVPKELVGTVYDFDQFDEFDDGHASATLGDLRMRRGKRQSLDTTPQHYNFASPAQTFEPKASPATKRTREKKPKSGRDKSSKEGGISPFKISLPLSDPLSLDDVKPASKSSYMQERRKSTPSSHNNKSSSVDTSNSAATTAIVSSFPIDGTNQLRLKIKGPYANACLNSSLPISQPEASSAVTSSSSATSNLRRMRKKELIQQYCNQDMNVEQTDNPYHISNPPVQRAGISIPKAVASMPHIPTREDYKKYTQDDNSRISTGRRKKPRELKQLDWSFKDESPRKRSTSSDVEYPRKRPRIAKENRLVEEKESTKIVISLGKRSPEVVSSTVVDAKELSIRGKPPKKRLPDMMMKLKSDNMKFREEIMKNFDDGNSGKAFSTEKRSKRRKLCSSNDDKLDFNEQNSPDVKVVTDEASNKLVLKISKNVKDERASNIPNAHPLKIRLNLTGITKVDPTPSETHSPSSTVVGDNGPKKVMPLKIKLQRRAEGYVTSNCNIKKNTPLYHGPGPPQPELPPRPTEPPDPYSMPNLPSHSEKCGDIRIEHRDRESLTRDDHHSTISDDVFQQLEAHLAATDGGVTEDCPSISQASFSSLQPVPKDKPGCR